MHRILCLILTLLAVHVYVDTVAAENHSSDPLASADLMQLYHESRLEDPRVLAAYARAKAGDEHQREALGALLPQITANASVNRTTRDYSSVRESYKNQSYSLGLSQHIYNKAAWENYQKFKSLAKQAKSQSDEALAEATVDLAQRYFTALAADDELELVMAERRATQKNLDRVNALFKKKLAMITDVLDLQARVDSLAAQEVEARNQVRLSRGALSEIIGRPVTENLSRIRDDIEFRVPEESMESWVQRALVANPALKASESGVEAAEAALRGGKGGHYPALSLNLSAQQSDVGYNNALSPRTDIYVASIGLQVPIYSGGSTSARVRGLHQDQISAEEQLESTRRQVVKETVNAYLTAESSVEKIRANRNALGSAEKSRVAAEKAFTYGVVNAVDVLNSVQGEYKARRDLLKAQYDFITNLFILNRWAGSVSEASVGSVNVWLGNNRAQAPERNTTE